MSKRMDVRGWMVGAFGLLTTAGLLGMLADPALAGMGQPSPWQKDLQEAASPVMADIKSFHDALVWIITAISLFVLALMIYVMVRFNERANPTPSKTTHNAFLEVAWTVVPILILVGISIPSFKLLYFQYSFPKADLTIKAVGNQWNWTHSYPDHGNVEFTSIMLNDNERAEREKRGVPAPRLLAVDNAVVVPVDKNVHVLVTASDVIHAWTIPSFGSKVDAVPGRVTTTWFRATKKGIFYGQCSELCGKDHAFMPIEVRVVDQAVFDQWMAALRARDRRRARDIIEKAAIEDAQGRKVAGAETTQR